MCYFWLFCVSFAKKFTGTGVNWLWNVPLRQSNCCAHFRNQQGQGWIADEAGYLNSTGATVESINLGKIAFQIRYKYEIAPLSNLYLVYTRGGDYYFDDEAGTSKIYRKTWDNPENNKLVLKLRIKF